MRSKLMRRTLLMATLALAIVGASSLPASAVTTNLDFTDSNGSAAGGTAGTITINGTTVNIPGAGTGACDVAGATSYLSPDITAAGAVTLLTTDYKHDIGGVANAGLAPGTFNISGTDYRVQILGYANTAGTISGSSASVSINVKVVFSPCAGGTALCTVNNVAATLTGSYSGSLPPVSGDLATNLAGSTPALASSNFAVGCNATIRAALLGDTATANLHLEAA